MVWQFLHGFLNFKEKRVNIKVPNYLNKTAPNDAVSFECDGVNNTKAPCYANILGKISHCKLLCYPAYQSLLKEKDYNLFFDLCVKNKLINQNIKYYSEGGRNYLSIDKDKWINKNRPSIYIALCLYRLCDYLPQMIYKILRTVESMPNISFFQIYHYYASQYISSSGHSFVYLSTVVVPNVYQLYDWKNVANSVVLAHYAENINTKEMFAVNYFAKFARDLNPQFQYLLKNKKDILDEKFTPLYSGKITPAKFKKIMVKK